MFIQVYLLFCSQNSEINPKSEDFDRIDSLFKYLNRVVLTINIHTYTFYRSVILSKHILFPISLCPSLLCWTRAEEFIFCRSPTLFPRWVLPLLLAPPPSLSWKPLVFPGGMPRVVATALLCLPLLFIDCTWYMFCCNASILSYPLEGFLYILSAFSSSNY